MASKPATNYWSCGDEDNDKHQAGECDWETCSLCQQQALREEVEAMAEQYEADLKRRNEIGRAHV